MVWLFLIVMATVDAMKQWTMTATGRANLELTDGPVPQPAPTEILVETSAVALNYRDRLAIDQGLTMVFPDTGPFVANAVLVLLLASLGVGVRCAGTVSTERERRTCRDL